MHSKEEFVVGSSQMAGVVQKLRKVAGLDTTVLLHGETGTGKELAARFLHENHPTRRNGPMISVHCGAITESLLESELFGHVRGAFTGAERDRPGKFEQAEGGTLFLDEIGTMTPGAQIRLLRVLQERQVTRVGASEPRPVNVRVVVATNLELKSLIEQEKFRLDLFYRVNTYPVSIPPLRDRPGDVSALVPILAQRIAGNLGLGAPREFGVEALRALAMHDWPGNVRELANAVEYASIQCDEGHLVAIEQLPAEISGVDLSAPGGGASVLVTSDGLSFRTAVTNLERELILQSLNLADGNKARAAELLELKRTTFLEKLRRLEKEGLMPEDYPERSREVDSAGFAA